MICRTCRGCGLCPDQMKDNRNLCVETAGKQSGKIQPDENIPGNFIGIAFDIGTTTVACSCYRLFNGEILFSFGEANSQIIYGSDVVSRISFCLNEKGLNILNKKITEQIEKMTARCVAQVSSIFFEKRWGRPELKKIFVAGNTAMESIFAGKSVAGLASFPFSMGDRLGRFFDVASIFGASDFIPQDCTVYLAPCIGPFAGGDCFCSMIAAGFIENDGRTKFLADVGTNCEMCVKDGVTGKVFCTSTAAGPAFEGFGIECGAAASEGCIVEVKIKQDEISYKVIGGGEATKISGTGIISAVAGFLENGIIDGTGAFVHEECEKFHISDKVYLSQKDIRNFQTAKASVFCGLKILSKKIESSGTCVLFLSGGFGTSINPDDAVKVRMIPEKLCGDIHSIGNSSLTGISMLMLDEGLRIKGEQLFDSCTVVDLAQEKDFQESFLSSIDFQGQG